ncbi:MAG: hypothetical protein L3J95_05950 [Thermoplasmata archaeon]|nr:hypothetical protein [Thermoplasmata archaeon]MCI4359940.1 hypothetical protein [Thermoplasmata archaeon]
MSRPRVRGLATLVTLDPPDPDPPRWVESRVIDESDPIPRSLNRTSPPTARLLTAAVAGLVVVGLVAGIGSGMMPWAGFPGYRSDSSSSSGSVSFSEAVQAASTAAAGYSSAGWYATSATGLNLLSSIVLPGPSGNTTPLGGPCGWTANGGHGFGSVTVPAAPGSVGHGTSPAWFVSFSNPVGAMLVVNVLNGQATVYGSTAGGPYCYNNPGLRAIPSTVIDSTQAVAYANAWGGSAFLANTSGSNEVMTISGPISIPFYGPPPFVGGVGYVGGPCNGSVPTNGVNCTQPIYANYTEPSLWTVGYSTCPGLVNVPCGSVANQFNALLNATSGAVLQVSASLGNPGACGVPYACYGGGGSYLGGPPPPVLVAVARS